MVGLGVGGSVAGMWIMGLFGLLVLAGVIVLIVWTIQAGIPAKQSRVPAGAANPLAIESTIGAWGDYA